jgi:hypothetical protein
MDGAWDVMATLRDTARWPLLRRYVPAASIAALVGVLHRGAAMDAWADDRSLAAQPPWLQVAAPLWHAVVHGSASIANGLTHLVDPLTSASTAGDSRALAATFAALGAGTLFVALRGVRVPGVISLLLCAATTGWVLPIAAAVSLSEAVQLLLGAALILTWSAPASRPRLRHGVLAAVTALGALTHASFVAFAAGVWAVEWLVTAPGARTRVALLGAGTLAGSLLLASWLLSWQVVAPLGVSMDRPDGLAVAIGLLTGRFAPHLQPWHAFDLLSAMRACVPAPMSLTLPLAALAFARRETRPLALACALATIGLVAFLAGTWLPDPRMAGAPARLAMLVLAGLSLSWVANQPARGALVLAVASSALLGLRGFVEPVDWRVTLENAQLRAFVEAAPESIGRGVWAAEHIAVGRVLLAAHRELGGLQQPARTDLVATVPDRPLIVIGSSAREAGTRILHVPFDVPYPSATRFLESQPERLWIAVALRGTADGFCGDLLASLNVQAQTPDAGTSALLAHVGAHEPRHAFSAADRLDVAYGQTLAGAPSTVPARFAIEATPSARILINGMVIARADPGMAIATFDPWTAAAQSWRIGPCSQPVLPPIPDLRLATAYVFDHEAGSLPRRMPIIASAAVGVSLASTEPFGEGWYPPEGTDDQPFRWTAARAADVHVAVTHRQPLRVRMNGTLASAGGANALALSWNGTVIRPLAPWSDRLESDWLVPETLVRRGSNVLTIHVGDLVSPAAGGTSGDTRTLGAVIHRLSIEPALP